MTELVGTRHGWKEAWSGFAVWQGIRAAEEETQKATLGGDGWTKNYGHMQGKELLNEES